MQKLSIYFSLLLGNFEEEYPMQIVYCKADQNSMLVNDNAGLDIKNISIQSGLV